MEEVDLEKVDLEKVVLEKPDPPAYVLTQFAHLLPNQGKALDLACGLGGNAHFMANQGLEVTAWDISELAIDKLNDLANKTDIQLHAEVRDVESNPPQPNSFDVIVVSRFLYRPLCPHLSAALKPNGMLYYQTFTKAGSEKSGTGPSNPAYLLEDNELPVLFNDLEIKIYQDESAMNEQIDALKAQACLVAQKN